MNEKIELNEEFKKAFHMAENTGKNLFITGRAGTGKSTFLEYFKRHTNKKAVFLAPTGVAALNVGGETIHSFFGFKPDISAAKIKKINGKKAAMYSDIDIIVIDEISMVRADLLDYVDKFLKLNVKKAPFGGIQMLFIGDLYQLPPVVTSSEKGLFKTIYKSPYFFDSLSFKESDFELIEFEKVYRQKDEEFIKLLNSVRNKTAGGKEISFINSRVKSKIKEEKYMVWLTPYNSRAAQINEEKLYSLGAKTMQFQAQVQGDFGREYYPTDSELSLAEGAQVMFLNNDSQQRWVNGTIGIVEEIYADSEDICVRLQNGEIVNVEKHKWEIFHYEFDEHKKCIKIKVMGSFTQFPLKLAWAVTIHKSQGKTYDKVILDIDRGTFAPGQLYVALSRCRSLSGLTLQRPVKLSDILSDWRVSKFLTEWQYKKAEKDISLEERHSIIEKTIKTGGELEITYLKASNEKSIRRIKPLVISECEFQGHRFIALRAICRKAGEERSFKIERILKIKEVSE
ncbi:MAG: hypothetical protein Fur0012_05980 [Elusimicrobiota bacterium]